MNTTTNSPEAHPQGTSRDLHSLICGVIHRHCKDVQLPFGINGLEKDLIEALTARADLPRATADGLAASERFDLQRAIAESDIAGCSLDDADIDTLVDLFDAWLERRTPALPEKQQLKRRLVELREMCPERVVDVLRQYGAYQTLAQDTAQVYDFWRVVIYDRMLTTRKAGVVGNLKIEAATLADCMAQVCAAAQTKSHESVDSSQATHESNTSTLTPEGAARPKMI